MSNETDELRFITNDNARTTTAYIRGLLIERVEATVGDYDPFTNSSLWTADGAVGSRIENGAFVRTNELRRAIFNGMNSVTDGWVECVFTKLNSSASKTSNPRPSQAESSTVQG